MNEINDVFDGILGVRGLAMTERVATYVASIKDSTKYLCDWIKSEKQDCLRRGTKTDGFDHHCRTIAQLTAIQSQLATAEKQVEEYKDALAVKFNAEMCGVLKPIRDKIITEQEKVKELREHLEVCEECGKTTDVGKGNYLLWCKTCWEKVVMDNKRLRDGLQALYDEQNGPPLLRDEESWNAAMKQAEDVVKETSDG